MDVGGSCGRVFDGDSNGGRNILLRYLTLFTACKKKRSRFYGSWCVGALPLHREPLLPCVAILCVDLSEHDKFVQVENKAF